MIARLVSLATVGALLSTSGCYYAFGTNPAPLPAHCTTSRALPITDLVIAGYGALGLGFGAWALIAIEDDGSLPAGEAKSTAALLAIMGGVMLIGNGLSARSGFRGTAECRGRERRSTLPPGYYSAR